jgi:hypothetical protein
MNMYSEIMLLEHTWAIKLKEAILNVGRVALVQTMPSPLALAEMGIEIASAVEAAKRLELTQPIVSVSRVKSVEYTSSFHLGGDNRYYRGFSS